MLITMAKSKSKLSTDLTARGGFCLCLIVLLLLIGGLLGDGACLTLGLSALTLMLCCYILGRVNLSKLEVGLSLPHKCHANKVYDPQMVIKNNRSLLDSFHISVNIVLPHATVLSSQAAWIPARSLANAKIPMRIPMRVTEFEHLYQLSSFFPLNLFRFSKNQTLQQAITVYPRSIAPKELLDHGVSGQCYQLDQNSAVNHSGESRSIREWQPGDPAKNIHWPASIRSLARGDGLKIREFDPPGLLPEEAVIVFHSFSSQREMVREDAFERAIALTAGSIAYLRNLNVRTELVADFIAWNPIFTKSRAQYYECLSILADAQRAMGTEMHELQTVLDAIPDSSKIIVISDMPSEVWRSFIQVPESVTLIDIEQVYFPFQKTISPKQALSNFAKKKSA